MEGKRTEYGPHGDRRSDFEKQKRGEAPDEFMCLRENFFLEGDLRDERGGARAGPGGMEDRLKLDQPLPLFFPIRYA